MRALALGIWGHSNPRGPSWRGSSNGTSEYICSPRPCLTLSPASLLGGLSPPLPLRSKDCINLCSPLKGPGKQEVFCRGSIEVDNLSIISLLTRGASVLLPLLPLNSPKSQTRASENKGKEQCIGRDPAIREKQSCWRRQKTICMSSLSPLHLRLQQKHETKTWVSKKENSVSKLKNVDNGFYWDPK